MCAVSNVGDYYSEKTSWPWPNSIPWPTKEPTEPYPFIPYDIERTSDKVKIQELETELAQLKIKFAQVKKELEDAKRQDEAEGSPDCEMDDKVIILKKIAKLIGESLDEIFPNEKKSILSDLVSTASKASK